MKSSTIIGGASDKHARHASDFYETPAECTVALMDFLDIQKGEHIWEPACGNLAISNVLDAYGCATHSSDIRDIPAGDGGIDFLKSECDFHFDWIITNPPFNLSEEFIRKALSYAPNVAMLLKSNYWHAAKRQNLFDETQVAYVLPMTWRPAMAPDRGNAPTLDFIWTVWTELRPEEGCMYEPLKKPSKERMKELGL